MCSVNSLVLPHPREQSAFFAAGVRVQGAADLPRGRADLLGVSPLDGHHPPVRCPPQALGRTTPAAGGMVGVTTTPRPPGGQVDTGTGATDVDRQVEELAEAATRAGNGRSARMLFGGPESTLTQTVIAMREGARLGEHESPGEATMLVLRGRLRVTTATQSWEAGRGELLDLPQEMHAVEALEGAAFLLSAAKLRSH